MSVVDISKQYSIEDLRAAIAIKERQAFIDMQELPKPVENPDFTEVTKLCQEYVRSLVQEKYVDDDLDHYIYEAAMNAVFGKGIFDYMRKWR